MLANSIKNAFDSSEAAGKFAFNISGVSVSESADGKKYIVDISFDHGGAMRSSLDPDTYKDMVDLIYLFNNGYTAGGVVHGPWHDNENQASLPHREPSHFVQNGVANFKGKAPADAEIIISGLYK